MRRPGFDVLGVCNDMLDEVRLIVFKRWGGHANSSCRIGGLVFECIHVRLGPWE